ncbi:MAG: hypothetical protein AAGM22_29350, partial [Acidobacteriota bacterium]
QLSDRYEAGVILEQSIAPQVETTSSETVDVVFSLGSCYWTHQFAQRFGLVSCRSGAAMSGLFCGNKNCGLWQLHCCPYSAGPDPEAELTESDWISPTGQFKARKGAVLDSLECRESGCPEMRTRYLKSPNLERKGKCSTRQGKPWVAEVCDEGNYVSAFSCRSGKNCSDWEVTCCPAESVPP